MLYISLSIIAQNTDMLFSCEVLQTFLPNLGHYYNFLFIKIHVILFSTYLNKTTIKPYGALKYPIL